MEKRDLRPLPGPGYQPPPENAPKTRVRTPWHRSRVGEVATPRWPRTADRWPEPTPPGLGPRLFPGDLSRQLVATKLPRQRSRQSRHDRQHQRRLEPCQPLRGMVAELLEGRRIV